MKLTTLYTVKRNIFTDNRMDLYVSVLRYFAINRDLGADAQYCLDRFADETGCNVLDDADKQLEAIEVPTVG